MRSFLRASGIAAGMRHLDVFQAWDAALGRELARRARPVGFQSGTLHVEVQSAVHLHELQNFTGDSFRAAANDRLGRTEIRKVVFRLKR